MKAIAASEKNTIDHGDKRPVISPDRLSPVIGARVTASHVLL
jgi:hypothetical protein